MAAPKCPKCSAVMFSSAETDIQGTKHTLITCSSCGAVVGAFPKDFWHIYNTVDQISTAVSDIYKMVAEIKMRGN